MSNENIITDDNKENTSPVIISNQKPDNKNEENSNEQNISLITLDKKPEEQIAFINSDKEFFKKIESYNNEENSEEKINQDIFRDEIFQYFAMYDEEIKKLFILEIINLSIEKIKFFSKNQIILYLLNKCFQDKLSDQKARFIYMKFFLMRNIQDFQMLNGLIAKIIDLSEYKFQNNEYIERLREKKDIYKENSLQNLKENCDKFDNKKQKLYDEERQINNIDENEDININESKEINLISQDELNKMILEANYKDINEKIFLNNEKLYELFNYILSIHDSYLVDNNITKEFFDYIIDNFIPTKLSIFDIAQNIQEMQIKQITKNLESYNI